MGTDPLDHLWKNKEFLTVRKPGQYLGREWNITVKTGQNDAPALVLAFPDIYEIGMSYVGLHILYQIFNSFTGFRAERTFLPWPDMAEVLKRKGIPLFSWETKTPVREFDVLGITLQHELSYTNVLYILELAGIPFRSQERGEGFPLVLGGGPCMANPEPVADFFDCFFIGEVEEAAAELVHIWKEMRGSNKESLLKEMSRVKGVYVPSLYPLPCSTSRIGSTSSANQSLPPVVEKRWVKDLDRTPYPEKMIVPFVSIVHDRASVEIARGCPRGCRFCQAGMIYRPHRERSSQTVVNIAEKLIQNTGYNEVSLLSLSSTDHSQIQALVQDLTAKMRPYRVNVSLPSLRMDTFSLNVARSLQTVRKSGLTFAPEAGTERMRRIINKGLTDADIFQTLETAFSLGWREVKLYFMIGLPQEREEDIRGIARLVLEGIKVGRKAGKAFDSLHVSASAFVPKPQTPFQWVAQEKPEVLKDKVGLLRSLLKRDRGVRFHWSDFETNLVEAALARGDRKLSKVIERVYQGGGFMQSWREFFSFARWEEAFTEEGLSLGSYAQQPLSISQVLPWGHISFGVSPDFLWEEYQKATREELTLPCRPETNCKKCGVCF